MRSTAKKFGVLNLVLALNLGLGGTVLAQDAATDNIVAAPVPANIDQLMSRYFKADRPGAIVLVTKDGNTIFRKAYGMANLEQQIALQPDMAMRIGSITKQFTAAAIMLLAEQGKLSLTDDITRYLPGYATHGATITIEHLLTHTSGTKNYTALPQFASIARAEMTVAQMLQLIQKEPLEFRPGDRFVYSNSGYFLLGAIIEQVSGISYASFMEKNIFAPLQLRHTFYDSNVRVIPSRVDGYSKTRQGFDNAAFLSLSIPFAAGALRSSVDDLAHWNAAIVAGKLLRPESWKRMMSSSLLSNGKPTGYGYGWFVRKIQGRDALEHGGDINGFSGDTMRFPAEGYYIAILVNSDTQEPDTQTLAEKIAALLLP